MSVNLNDLTPEQKAQLMAEAKEEMKSETKRKYEEREAFKALTEEVTSDNVLELIEWFEAGKILKKKVFESYESIIETKSELYNVKSNQKSHTFSTEAGYSITLGYRTVHNYDDTIHEGIAKIKKWLYGDEDENSEKTKTKMIIDTLLKRDGKGNLAAPRVLELRQLANDINDENFTDGVDIIEKAYKPLRSSFFIELYKKDEAGKKVPVPLNMTGIPMGGDK